MKENTDTLLYVHTRNELDNYNNLTWVSKRKETENIHLSLSQYRIVKYLFPRKQNCNLSSRQNKFQGILGNFELKFILTCNIKKQKTSIIFFHLTPPPSQKRSEKPNNNTNLPSVNIFLKFIHNNSSWSKGSRFSLLCSWKVVSVHRNTHYQRESHICRIESCSCFALLTLFFLKDFQMPEQFSPYEIQVVPVHFGPVQSKIKSFMKCKILTL